MPLSPDFLAHRTRLLNAMGSDEAMLIFGSPHHRRNGDAEYRYRPDSDVYWISGWTQPLVAVFLRPGAEPFTIFCQAKDPEREIWTGYRPGPEGAVSDFGADQAFSFDTIETELATLMLGVRKLHYSFGVDPEYDALVKSSIQKAGRTSRFTGQDTPEVFLSLSVLLHEQRLIKGPDELALLRAAAQAGADAHRTAMQYVRAGMNEHEIEAEILRVFASHRSTGAGYTSIVAAGANATCLHYIENNSDLQDGDLLLIDAGCEISYYTSDITRTFPISGRFQPAQRALYDVVLRAQLKAIEACRVGRSFKDIHDLTVRVLTEGMIEVGLLDGDVDEIIESEGYKRYYMHGTSHWLGLDVHDVGSYGRGGCSRALAPGMVLTVEPGIYVPVDDDEAPEAYRGIGIRIEDDVLITDGPPEVLTDGVPKHPDELVRFLAGKAPHPLA